MVGLWGKQMNGGNKIKMIVVSEEKEADGWAGAHRTLALEMLFLHPGSGSPDLSWLFKTMHIWGLYSVPNTWNRHVNKNYLTALYEKVFYFTTNFDFRSNQIQSVYKTSSFSVQLFASNKNI